MGQLDLAAAARLPRPQVMPESVVAGDDPVQIQPEFEFYLRAERTGDRRSVWRHAVRVETEATELSVTQRHWIAAVLRHAALTFDRGNDANEGSLEERLIYQIRQFRTEQKAASARYLSAVASLAVWKGEQFAASALGMKRAEIRHILKNRPDKGRPGSLKTVPF